MTWVGSLSLSKYYMLSAGGVLWGLGPGKFHSLIPSIPIWVQTACLDSVDRKEWEPLGLEVQLFAVTASIAIAASSSENLPLKLIRSGGHYFGKYRNLKTPDALHKLYHI